MRSRNRVHGETLGINDKRQWLSILRRYRSYPTAPVIRSNLIWFMCFPFELIVLYRL